MAVLQMVAVPFPPYLTPPGHPGGEIQTANQYSSPETQPLTRRVGWGLWRVGWGLRRVGWGLRRVGWGLKEGWLGSEEGWLGSEEPNYTRTTYTDAGDI